MTASFAFRELQVKQSENAPELDPGKGVWSAAPFWLPAIRQFDGTWCFFPAAIERRRHDGRWVYRGRPETDREWWDRQI